MGRISEEDIERVRVASDLVAIAAERVVLKQSGRKFKACCPFHDEKTPSFQIDPELGLWHCFGCGEGGDVFDFVQRVDNLDFPDAVRLLAARTNITLTEIEGGIAQPTGHKERLKAVCAATEEFYHHVLMRDTDSFAAAGRNYLARRGFGSDICKRWKLGYAPGRGLLVAHLRKKGFSPEEMVDANVAYKDDGGRIRDRFYNRVMFPIHDKLGATIAFGGRILDSGNPKYLNSSETLIFHKSSNMFGIDRAKNSITNEACAVVVEGYTDVIAMHECGVTNTVATLGTALTQQHVKMLRSLRPKRIIYLFDGDSAGQKAADRAIDFIDWSITPESGMGMVEFCVAVLPDNQDPADFCSNHTKDEVVAILTKAEPLIGFAIRRRLAKWNLASAEQRELALNEAVSLLVPIADSLMAKDYMNEIGGMLTVAGYDCDYKTVVEALKRAVSRERSKDRSETQTKDAPKILSTKSRETETERIEREMLTLVAKHPQALGLLRRHEDAFEWSSETVKGYVRAFLETDAKTDIAMFISQVEERAAGLAQYLSAGTVEIEDEEQAVAVISKLLADLMENHLLKCIRLGNAKLKKPDEMSPAEYDDVFKQTAALQKKLNELRNAQTGQKRP
ncbi:MAG: DNA primase [Actinobacteria bacterium]|nr:DNA primase [Actinomycetota bacterium]